MEKMEKMEKIKSSMQIMMEKSIPPLIILKMEYKTSPEFIQGLQHNTSGEVDTLFDIFEEELKKLRAEVNANKSSSL